MSFSAEWDQRYKENTHMSVWPWSDVVSFVMRYAKPGERPLRVLELGCGAGANIPFFKAVAREYRAIEGSAAIVDVLRSRYPELKDHIVCGDFTREIPFQGTFDLVVDRSSVTHNTTEAIGRCLDMVHAKLNPKGLFLGIDWFSTEYSKFKEGESGEDPFTRTGYRQGNMANVGRVHFSDEEHLRQLFHRFDITALEHKIIQRKIPSDGWSFAGWNFIAAKK